MSCRSCPLFRVFLISIVVVIASATMAVAHHKDDETRVRLIYGIIKFVEINNNKKLINFCTIGKVPLEHFIGQLPSEPIKGKKIILLNNVSEDAFSTCSIVYIGSSESDLRSLIKKLKKHKALTISDIDGFAQMGGIVELQNFNGKTWMYFNNTEAISQGISISSKLLQVGKKVF